MSIEVFQKMQLKNLMLHKKCDAHLFFRAITFLLIISQKNKNKSILRIITFWTTKKKGNFYYNSNFRAYTYLKHIIFYNKNDFFLYNLKLFGNLMIENFIVSNISIMFIRTPYFVT